MAQKLDFAVGAAVILTPHYGIPVFVATTVGKFVLTFRKRKTRISPVQTEVSSRNQQVSLQWSHVSCKITTKNGETKHLLRDQSAVAKPDRCVWGSWAWCLFSRFMATNGSINYGATDCWLLWDLQGLARQPFSTLWPGRLLVRKIWTWPGTSWSMDSLLSLPTSDKAMSSKKTCSSHSSLSGTPANANTTDITLNVLTP